MALKVRRLWLVFVVTSLALALLLGWAWWDGGTEPLRLIAEPVTIPGSGQ